MTRVSILIVEDDFIVARVLEKNLRDLGYEVVGMVATGGDAVQKAGELRPDLILMDIRLEGDMDGIQAADRIRERLRIPVVYLTAYSDEETLNRAIASSPYGYLIKPFSVNTLRTTIEVALRIFRLDRNMKEQISWLTGTVKSLDEGILTVNRDVQVVFMNPAAENLTGWKNEQANRKPLDEIMVFQDSISEQAFRYYLVPVFDEGIIATVPKFTSVLSRSGERRLLEDSIATPIHNSRGGVVGATIVLYPEQPFREDSAETPASGKKAAPEICIVFKEGPERVRESEEPHDADGWYERGNSLVLLRRYEDAIRAYDRALGITPVSFKIWYNKGIALDRMGRPEDALQAFEQAISIQPKSPDAWHKKGEVLDRMGKSAESKRCFDLEKLYRNAP